MVGVQQQHASIRNAQGGHRFTDQVIEARCIDDVDLVVPPFGVEHRAVHAAAALVFQVGVVADRVLVLDAAAALDQTRFEEHGFGQRGLAASVGAEQNDVLDVFGIEDFHGAKGVWVDVGVTCHRGGPLRAMQHGPGKDARRMA